MWDGLHPITPRAGSAAAGGAAEEPVCPAEVLSFRQVCSVTTGAPAARCRGPPSATAVPKHSFDNSSLLAGGKRCANKLKHSKLLSGRRWLSFFLFAFQGSDSNIELSAVSVPSSNLPPQS